MGHRKSDELWGGKSYLCDKCKPTPWQLGCETCKGIPMTPRCSACHGEAPPPCCPLSTRETWTETKFESKKELYEHIMYDHDSRWSKCLSRCGLPHTFRDCARYCDLAARDAHRLKGCDVTTVRGASVPRMGNSPTNRRLIERFIRESIRCQNA